MGNVSIRFDSGYTKSSGEKALYAVLWVGNRKVKFHTGVCVREEEFNEKKQQVRASRENHKDENLILKATLARINDIQVRYRLQNEPLTAELLKKEYQNTAARIDFHHFLREAIHERRVELSENSIRQHYAMANKLKAFAPTLRFAQLDSEFMVRFNRYLIKCGNEENTRYNNFKNLKAYLNIAVRKKIISHNPLLGWMPVKQQATSMEYLTEDEVHDLVTLYDRDFLPDNLHRVLRHFLFMCFTGLRISDLRSLEMDQLIGDTLIYSAIKTKNTKKTIIRVPLTKTAKRLIQDESPHRIQGKVFKTYSEQQMRKKVKDIAKVIGVNRDISLHTARHTFATLFLRRTKNLAVLQRLLGHSKIEQTMIYAHILTEDIQEEMDEAFRSFS